MQDSSSRKRHTTFVPATNVVPITERQAAGRFAAIVIGLEAGDLATAAKRTKEAAKEWKKGSRCPNTSSMINMARSIPLIRSWLFGEIDGSVPQGNPNTAMNAVLSGLHLVAGQPTEEGAAARALLASMTTATHE